MNGDAKAIAWAISKAALRALRYVLYVFLSVVARIIYPVARVVGGCGLFVFLFLALFRRDLSDIMWSAGGVALGAGLVSAGYDALLRLVAPAGVVIVSEV